MSSEQSADLTQLLRAWSNGDEAAEQAVVPMIYPELERRAKIALQRSVYRGETIQTRGLVHEAFLKLTKTDFVIRDQMHFYALCSSILRHILIDYFRRQKADRRGGSAQHVTLSKADTNSPPYLAEQMLELDDLLNKLKELYPRKARICEMHYFGGLTADELADYEHVSASTINKDLRFARAWMHTEAVKDQIRQPNQ